MDKLTKKPVKTDFRWRLVYPIHFYDEVKEFTDSINVDLKQCAKPDYDN